MLSNFLIVVVVFAILIFIHELGHLLACKVSGIKVEKFSLGFGPPLIQWKSAETTYMVSLVPLGGYIKMEGEDYGTTGFFAEPVRKKVLVLVSGPGFNLVLGFVLLVVLYAAFGAKVPEARIVPRAGSRAAEAGLAAGDLVVRLNGDSVRSFYALDSMLQRAESTALTFLVQRGDSTRLEITLYGRPDSLELEPFYAAVVGGVKSGSAAAHAGIQPGDVILAVDTVPVLHWMQFTQLVRPAAGVPLNIKLRRGQDTITCQVTPRLVDDLMTGEKVGQIGIERAELGIQRQQIPFPRAVGEAVTRTGVVVVKTFEILFQLLTGQISPRHVSGPVMVGKIVYQGVQSGAEMLLAVWAMLSLNLFVINMLPVPFLDGGRAVLFIFEGIRRRKLTPRQWDMALRIGLHLVVMLVILALSNDFLNMINLSDDGYPVARMIQMGVIALYAIFAGVEVTRAARRQTTGGGEPKN